MICARRRLNELWLGDICIHGETLRNINVETLQFDKRSRLRLRKEAVLRCHVVEIASVGSSTGLHGRLNESYKQRPTLLSVCGRACFSSIAKGRFSGGFNVTGLKIAQLFKYPAPAERSSVLPSTTPLFSPLGPFSPVPASTRARKAVGPRQEPNHPVELLHLGLHLHLHQSLAGHLRLPPSTLVAPFIEGTRRPRWSTGRIQRSWRFAPVRYRPKRFRWTLLCLTRIRDFTVIFTNVSHVGIGAYLFEALQSVGYEWSVITGKRKFRTPMLVRT